MSIDWNSTQKKYGYDHSNLGYRPFVVCICDKCGKESDIRIRTKSRIINKQMVWECPKCVGNRKEVSEKLRKSTLNSWRDPEYRSTMKDFSKKLWESEEYRKKHHDGICRIKSAKEYKSKAWEDPEYRRELSDRSKDLWKDEEYRKKMVEGRNKSQTVKLLYNDEYKTRMSKKLKGVWQNPEHHNKMKEIWDSQEFKDRMSESLRKRWSNEEFRVRMREIWRDKAYKDRISEISKELWKDPEYREKVVGKYDDECRKEISERAIEMWKNPEYRKKMEEVWNSEGFRCRAIKNGKKLWQDPKFVEEASNRSVELWKDPEYRKKITEKCKEVFKDPKFMTKSREDARKLWKDPEYRKKIEEKCKEIWDDLEYRKKMFTIFDSSEHKEKISKIFNDPDFRKRLSINSKKLWEDPGYRENIISKCKEIWNDPSYREKMEEIFRSPEHKRKIQELWQDPEYRKRMAQIRVNQPKTSFQQSILYSILDDLKIKYYKDSDKECMVGFYTFDCRIDPQDGIKLRNPLLIEVQGDYWHGLPKAVRNDKSKSTYLKSYFPDYELKYLWEHEFNNKDRITNLIKYWLGMEQANLIDFKFDNIEQRIIDFKEAEIFVSKYHYAGRVGRSGVNLGHYLGDELVAVIVYSQPVRQEIAIKQGYGFKEVLELSRLAIHPSYQKKNLASFIISKSIKTVKELRPEIKLLVSFADSTHNHSGTIYKASNWTLDGTTDPDYWYSDEDGYVCHKKTLWNHAKRMSMTEKEYCQKYKYNKIWGMEKSRYIYRIY